MADIEVNFPLNVKLTRVVDDNWTARLTRRSGEKDYWVGEYRNLSPAEIYTKFGVEVPTFVTQPKGHGKNEAEKILRGHLTNIGSRTIVPASEVQDVLLDVLNLLAKTEEDDESTS